MMPSAISPLAQKAGGSVCGSPSLGGHTGFPVFTDEADVGMLTPKYIPYALKLFAD